MKLVFFDDFKLVVEKGLEGTASLLTGKYAKT